MILSFHPRIKGDVNLSLSINALFSEHQADLMAGADLTVVPQRIKAHQYRFCRERCKLLFPDYRHRFGFEGKYGNIELFRMFNAPYPRTEAYISVNAFMERHTGEGIPRLGFPLVVKSDTGGGGWGVFLVRDKKELQEILKKLADIRRHPTQRFIAQVFVPHGGRDLRVVVIGKSFYTYWRCQPDPQEFRNNVGRGAFIEHNLDSDLIYKGVSCVRAFCERTGIDLAAFDLLFDRSRPDPEPLLSEINFLFGRKGVGGSDSFIAHVKEAVDQLAQTL